ncbi:unnamed protein product [Paramecium primaurelia]|uniref:Uncharacterized protein n=1 Tax=Paramecium primaurelia TaxID=5886 RepID=A0A8S1MCE1_PARPR|nr:unnamed protein product [Paramecium primaurelia]
MEKIYIEQITKQQEELDERLKQAQNYQYVEYVSSKMDDILKFQQQENSNLQQSKQFTLPVEELIGLAKELDTRFQRSIRQLQLKQEQLEIEQNKWKNQLREKEQEQLLQLEQEKNQIDKQFKERLRTIHMK